MVWELFSKGSFTPPCKDFKVEIPDIEGKQEIKLNNQYCIESTDFLSVLLVFIFTFIIEKC